MKYEGKKKTWEGSKEDKKMDKAQKARGIKEGSKEDEAIDRRMRKKYGWK